MNRLNLSAIAIVRPAAASARASLRVGAASAALPSARRVIARWVPTVAINPGVRAL